MRVLIDGEVLDPEDAAISIFDWAVQRGFGVFEVVRSHSGVPFRLDSHLARLQRSAAALGVVVPGSETIGAWVRQVAESGRDCQIRIIVSGGGRDPMVAAPARTIVAWEPLPAVPDRLSVLPMRAPWHPGRADSGFPGIKWTSYAPNMASTDKAMAAGFDDALLLGDDDVVLEGPTFTVAWVTDGRLETPSLDLGILHSITRDVLLESAARLEVPVVESAFPLERLLRADEALGLSTTKHVRPIERVGDHTVAVGDIGAALAGGYAAIVASEVAGAVQ